MQCPHCQAENRQGRRFCAQCGVSLPVACPSCGFSNEPGEKFCGGCGLPLTAARPPLEPRSGLPHAYTPSHLAEKILTSKSAVEGERKQVTVLFADLKGSMELLADRDPEEARQLLDPVLGEFLYEAGIYPDLEYTFKHALTHEVTYGSLLQDRRRTLHGRIVETIERGYPDRQAGAKAFARSAHREALASFEQALTALTHLPETRETLEQAIDVRFDLRNALYPLAEFGRIEGYLREAEALARTLDDQRRLGWVSAYMGSHHWATGGDANEVRRCAQRVEAIAEPLSDVPLQVVAQYNLLSACHLSGDYRGTEHHCRRLMQSLQGERIRERFGVAVFPAVQSRVFFARALAERGVFDEGDVVGQEAIRIADALDHPHSLIFACLGLAYLDSVKGELSQAAHLLERAVARCRDWNITLFTPIATASLGHVYAWSGRIGEGISWLQQALAVYESAGIGWWHSISVVQLGEAYLLADQVEDARACADRAVMLARQRGERGYEAWALRLLGEIASHHHRPDAATAEAHYGAAMALASELGMRPLAAHCHLGLGTLYCKRGRLEHARAELSTAIELYRAMEMTFWLARAEAELAKAE